MAEGTYTTGAALGVALSLFKNKLQRLPFVRQPYMHAAFAVAGALLYNEVVEIEARQSKAIDDLLAKKGMRPSPKYD
eukprot:PRCOL_00006871-RA